MARKKNGGRKTEVTDYRHKQAKRKNNPPAKIAGEGTVPAVPKAVYEYNPHLPPVLRFDVEGKPDKLPELLAEARRRKLSAEEAQILADALRRQEPWLEWAGKRETAAMKLTVDPVALHIHERVSAQAILKVARRQDVARMLFGDPEQAYHEAVQFYRHDVDWTNRMILGDSLQVMSSLARRENLAGKVQMIYMDPPYGIKFRSNFQAEVGQRDVKDKESDLTREPEMVKAYRDTWRLGVHSYLSYLRDRLILAKELLADTGSIFVQIGDENLHRVQAILDEVFTPSSWRATITVRKTLPLGADGLTGVTDFVFWYTRNPEAAKRAERTLWREKTVGANSPYKYVLEETGAVRPLSNDEIQRLDEGDSIEALFRVDKLESAGYTPSCFYDFEHDGLIIKAQAKSWRTNQSGMKRVVSSGRVIRAQGSARPSYMLMAADAPGMALHNLWADLQGAKAPKYVVQTNEEVIKRCMLLTTDPGDLVLDPTCGSGTTAFVAEQWGRRWITIDTSRVAIAIARQRMLTAKFDRYRIKGEDENGVADGEKPNGKGSSPYPGFVYKTVPHVTLKSIAQNPNLDPIFARHEPILNERLVACNVALGKVKKDVRDKLLVKLVTKERAEGKRSITDADRRRWELPKSGKWEDWEVPFDADPDWPQALQDAVTEYRKAWRAKMDEVNACIAANAEQEELVDKPDVVRGVVRVTGPFTVEAVQPPEMSLGEPGIIKAGAGEGAFDGEPELLEGTFEVRPVEAFADTQNIPAYLDKMIRLLKADAVTFPNNKVMKFSRLEPVYQENATGLHAEGRWMPPGQADPDPEAEANVCVVFGPQYGPVTAMQVEEAVRAANRAGYEALVLAGFSFDGAASAVLDEYETGKLKRGCMVHMAHIRPDVNPGMDGLLKEQPGSQLFTVFGQPRTRVEGPDTEGNFIAHMDGVDIYNPVENSVTPTGAGKVAAWFIDGDYDGRTFCITQAFFPDRSAWKKLARALKGVVDEDRFEALSGTASLPFPAGTHRRVAVKVIDPRGNEVMRVHRLEKA